MDLADHAHVAASIRPAAEDTAHLIAAFNEHLKLGALPDHERVIVLSNVADGLTDCTKTFAHAWRAQVLALLDLPEDLWVLESPGVRHELVTCILEQPILARSNADRARAICTAATAALTLALGTGKVSVDFMHGLRQLFRSKSAAWSDFAKLDYLNPDVLSEHRPAVGPIQEFRDDLTLLVASALPSPDAYFQHREPTTGSFEDNVPSDAPTAGEKEAAATTETGRRAREKEPLSAAPNLRLFEAQCNASMQADNMDPWRLELHWNKLAPAELAEYLARLNVHLVQHPTDDRGWQLKGHAAARYLTLFAGQSLKRCWGLPLFRKGSLHYNVAQGLFRRDVLVVAPRVDRQDAKQRLGRWWRTRIPQEVADAMRTLCARHPGARTLGQLLQELGLNWDKCQDILNDGTDVSSHRAEDARFAASLRPCLLKLGIHPAVVARTTGDITTTPASDHYYLSLTSEMTHAAVAQFSCWARLMPPAPPANGERRIGSPRWIPAATFRSAVTQMQQLLRKARNQITSRSSLEQCVDFHNLYTLSCALQIIWGLGGRGDRIGAMSWESIFSSEDYILLGDRHVDKYAQNRVCPSPRVLTETRLRYVEHLQSFGAVLARACERTSKFTLLLATGKKPRAPAFHIYKRTEHGFLLRPLQRADLVEFARTLGISELNQPRHFWFTHLVELDVAQVAIEALLGHHTQGAEPFGFASGISIASVCSYLKPLLEAAHKRLGFEPLAGRGRQDLHHHTLPCMPADARLAQLPQVLLQRKIEAQDYLLREALHYAQDTPAGPQTLVAHAHVNRLRRSFRQRGADACHARGALLFNLILSELVLSDHELRDLYAAATGDGAWSVDRMVILEASSRGRPVVQRIVGCDTLIAMHMSREQVLVPDFDAAAAELHSLLKVLEPKWLAACPETSLQLLQRMGSHWAAVEVAPAVMFSVFHKAPFIPAQDLARLQFSRACIPDTGSEEGVERQPRRDKDTFGSRIQRIVNRWANKDKKLGEDLARAKGCAQDLRELRTTTEETFELFVIDLILADLSPHAPYRRLSVQTVSAYLGGYLIFSQIAAEEGTFALSPDIFSWAFHKMGGNPNAVQESTPARWQMLHICAFLGRRHWVPPAFIQGRADKLPQLPRLPVYLSQKETLLVVHLLSSSLRGCGGSLEFAGTRALLQRARPLRISEVRYLSAADLNPTAAQLHVTTTGHSHLKSDASRGSLTVPPELLARLMELQQRTGQVDSSPRAGLFADGQSGRKDAQYKCFDLVSDLIRAHAISLTGGVRFRQHDLRCCAATDLASDVEGIANRLTAGRAFQAPHWTAEAVTRAHVRYAWASRLARHASPLTTLRYYLCSGLLEVRQALDSADQAQAMPFSGSFVASLMNIRPGTFYERARRSREASCRGTQSFLHGTMEDWLGSASRHLPTPRLGSTYEEIVEGQTADVAAGRDHGLPRIVHAALLCLMGTPAQIAADTLMQPLDRVSELIEACVRNAQELGVQLWWSDDRSPLVGRTQPEKSAERSHQIARLAKWIHLGTPKVPASLLRAVLARADAGLLVGTEQQLYGLFPVTQRLAALGITTIFHPGSSCALSTAVGLAEPASKAGICISAEAGRKRGFGRLVFAPSTRAGSSDAEAGTRRISPRAIGRTGRLVVAALFMWLVVQQRKEKCT